MIKALPVWFFLPVLSEVSSIRVMPNHKNKTYAELGGDLSLVCDYELEDDELYSIKWYRDSKEFYSYMPSNKPNAVRIKERPGLDVDDLSSHTHLRVKNISLESSGLFVCEISGGPPRYPTAQLRSEVIVVDLPDTIPIISGVKSRYYLGDEVIASCWTDTSHPKPVIRWWINDNAADPGNVQTIHNGSTQLRFTVTEKYLDYNSLKLKCSVEILDIYWRSSEEEAQVSPAQSFSLPAFSKPIFTSSSPNLVDHSLLVALMLGSTLITGRVL